jgi:hypothetical protein
MNRCETIPIMPGLVKAFEAQATASVECRMSRMTMPEDAAVILREYEPGEFTSWGQFFGGTEKPLASEYGYRFLNSLEWGRCIPIAMAAGGKLQVCPTASSDEFERLYAAWRQKSAFLSSTTASAMATEYQQLIGMGPAVLPYLFDKLENDDADVFWALKAITRQDPVRDEVRGDFAEMKKAWLEWARSVSWMILI